MALTKWVKPVRISLGWPNDLKPFKAFEKDGVAVNDYKLTDITGRDPSLEPVAEEQIKTLIPSLQEATGLDIAYVPKEQETTDNYADVRILFAGSREHPKFPDKSGSLITSITSIDWPKKIYFRFDIERRLTSLVYYTPDSNRQVEGYFLPNGRNEIEFAVCFIPRWASTALIKALVGECLVRSLRLPDAVHSVSESKGSMVSLWNKKPENQENGPINDPEMIPSFTPYDALMLRTLYSPALKPGMSLLEAQEKLLGITFQ
ncbi:MAG: DUF2927 domain-containing protein [Rhodospirillales bacterium]|nr:DUF2927 domain-containing protein [Rhodospirillales bacterium]